MRVLCIDALDHRVVERLGLENLMLSNHGVLEVPVNARVKQPLSPEVWRAFLTGEYKPTDFVGDPKLLKALEYVRARVHIKLGLGRKFKTEKDYPEKDFTGFPEELGFKEVNMPYYSLDFPRLCSFTAGWLEGGVRTRDFLDWMFHEFMVVREKLLLEEEMVVAYFPQLDTVQHCFWREPEVVERWYRYFDGLAKEVEPHVIVSDHGAEKGMHSHEGFWSSSLPIGPSSIMDFKEIFKGLVEVKK